MKIRTQVFSWVFLATIVPLTTIALVATYYIESDYQRGVDAAVSASLDTLNSELKRTLELQVELADGLAKSNAVQDFLPSLKEADVGRFTSMFNVQRSRINHYFEGFQTILQGQFVMRLMDKFGNSYIKVSKNKRSRPAYEGISGVMFVEQEVDGLVFNNLLLKLPVNEVSTITLPHNAQQSSLMEILPFLDYVVPLYYDDELIGALSVTRFGERIDTILDHASRLYNAKLFITENNPDNTDRHGLMLYDDQQNIRFSQVRDGYKYLWDHFGDDLFNSIIDDEFGKITVQDQDEIIYYQEFYPYPTRLTNWVIGIRIPQQAMSDPFHKIRLMIWGIASISLLISLFLSDIGVRLIARPVRELASNLLSYSRGEHIQRVKINARIDEIRDLEVAFNTLADSLDKTSGERDEAQNMLLQSAKLASIGQMAAGIGHEINNPLNNILSYAKLLERQSDELSDSSKQDLKSLKEEAVRASEIIRGILNFARQVPPQYGSFEIEKWLSDTVNLVMQTAKTAGVNLTYRCEVDAVIEADRAQLQQALINLLINAVQTSDRDAEVVVNISYNKDDVIISVVDSGKGIGQDSLDLIFDPFYTTKPEGEGSGLGLSVSLGIIERHNGKLILKNNKNTGVTATMIIPIKHTQASDKNG
ncbi:signal transduction histidine kinase, nitrogen specific, NtrB [hydrothermal vent metagenome]|uniref:histidine kinase n=1 Tax=hydrothermal vent metagenome TaxID=652676 RepID=A0A3B1A0W6_9ZZZZ